MKLCKLAETTTITTASTSIVFVLRFVTVAATKLQISGKKNMIPMVVLILFGISMNLVRAENQYRQPHQQQQRYQNNRQQQRMQPNLSDVDNSAYYYECVLPTKWKSAHDFQLIGEFLDVFVNWNAKVKEKTHSHKNYLRFSSA